MNTDGFLKTDSRVLIILLFTSVVIRFFTFFPSVINHDESTYILIGSQLFNGGTYYVDLIDTKPIGIFLIYGLIDILSSNDVIIFRVFASIFIGLGGFLIYKVIQLFDDSNWGFTGGLFYIFSVSVFIFYGVSPNAEIFFIPITLISIYLLLKKNQHSAVEYLTIGLLLGIAFLVKFVVIAEVILVGGILAYRFIFKRKEYLLFVKGAINTAIGFWIPICILGYYYQSIGHLEQLLFYTFTTSGDYAQEMSILKRLTYFGDFAWRHFYLILPFTLSVIANDKNWIKVTFLLHALLVTLVILYLGRPFGHYQIQLLVPLIIVSIFYYRNNDTLNLLFSKYGIYLLLFSSIGLSAGQFLHYRERVDEPKEVLSYLAENYGDLTSIYTGDYHHILLHYLGAKPVNRYIHRSILFTEKHIKTLQVDLAEEAKIVLKASPEVVLLRRRHTINTFTELLRNEYFPVDTILNGELLVLEKP